MSMSNLDHRLQVLIDEQRLRSVRESAENAGIPVGQWIRDLIDERLGSESQGQKIRDFIAFAATMEPIEGDALDELRAARGARLDALSGLDGE